MRALDIGGRCNNNCFACERKKGNWAPLSEIYRADYLKGEATLHPEFLKILAMPAKTIETNGRAFSYMPLAMKARGHSWLVRIYGPDAKTHDSLTRTKGSFNQAVKGLKNLIDAGAKAGVLVPVTMQNYVMAEEIISKAKALGVRTAVLSLPVPGNDFPRTCPMYSQAAYHIERAVSADIPVTVRNMPPCFLKDARNHLECTPPGIRKGACNWCMMECDGLPEEYVQAFGSIEVAHHYPNEVKIELTDDCNLACGFCYRKGREKGKALSGKEHMKILESLKGLVRTVRFTGGEPLLSQHARQAIRCAKEMGFRIVINTNGTLPLPKEALLADEILIPLHGYDERDEREKTGKGLFMTKIDHIKRHREKIFVNTIATRQNIRDFGKFAGVVKAIGPKHWFWTIPEPVDGDRGIGRADVQKLVDEIKESRMDITISQALPFCSVAESDRMAEIYRSANLCGPWTSMHIDAFGNIRSCYMGRSYGNVRETDLRKAWKDIKAELDSIVLPKRCRTCGFITLCRGGCSLLLKERGMDPLMRK